MNSHYSPVVFLNFYYSTEKGECHPDFRHGLHPPSFFLTSTTNTKFLLCCTRYKLTLRENNVRTHLPP